MSTEAVRERIAAGWRLAANPNEMARRMTALSAWRPAVEKHPTPPTPASDAQRGSVNTPEVTVCRWCGQPAVLADGPCELQPRKYVGYAIRDRIYAVIDRALVAGWDPGNLEAAIQGMAELHAMDVDVLRQVAPHFDLSRLRYNHEPVPLWYRELRPFGDLWWAMDQAIRERLEPLSDSGLRQMIEDCAQVTNRNCWFAMYNVAPLVADEARRILYAREKSANATPHDSEGNS